MNSLYYITTHINYMCDIKAHGFFNKRSLLFLKLQLTTKLSDEYFNRFRISLLNL